MLSKSRNLVFGAALTLGLLNPNVYEYIGKLKDYVLEKWYDASYNYSIAKAKRYLPKALEKVRKEGQFTEDEVWEWKRKNIIFITGEEGCGLIILLGGKNDLGPFARYFALRDMKNDGSLDSVLVTTIQRHGNIEKIEELSYEKAPLNYQANYAIFLDQFSKGDMDSLEKIFPPPNIKYE